MSTVSISFKYDQGKKLPCKEIILPVVRTYIGGAVGVSSGDVYQARRLANGNYVATK